MITKSMLAAALASALSATTFAMAAHAATVDGQQRWNGQQRTGGQGTSTTRRGTAANQRGGTTATPPVVVNRQPVVVVKREPQPVREPVRVADRDDHHDYDRGYRGRDHDAEFAPRRRDDDGRHGYRYAERRDGRWHDDRGYHNGDTFRHHRRHHRHWWRRWW